MKNKNEIDIVILWVDGNDVNWQKEKNKYAPHVITENNSDNRFRDWDLLKYWFRAIDKFTPWVRKIHFVTWGHLPSFLNLNNEKVHIVRHDQFIPASYLPTFSSHAIEMNIHRIPGLSEKFIYFNDDMFLLKPVGPEYFFRDDLPCTYGAEIPIQLVGPIGIWLHAAVNDLGVVNSHFSKKDSVKKYSQKYRDKSYGWKTNLRTTFLQIFFPDYFTGFANLHAPAAYLKESFEDVWNAEEELLDKTCRDKFRMSDNVNQWVVLWWQIASGRFVPHKVDNFVQIITDSSIDRLCDVISSQKHDIICLNDPDGNCDFERLSVRLKNAFERILPEKSSYEV